MHCMVEQKQVPVFQKWTTIGSIEGPRELTWIKEITCMSSRTTGDFVQCRWTLAILSKSRRNKHWGKQHGVFILSND